MKPNEPSGQDRESYAVEEAEFTPGPWKWELYSDGYALVSESSKIGTVRRAVKIAHDTPDGQLIEAAPNLLAALEDLIEDAEAYSDGLGCVSCPGGPGEDEDGNDTEVDHADDCRFVKAKAIVAKARGKV